MIRRPPRSPLSPTRRSSDLGFARRYGIPGEETPVERRGAFGDEVAQDEQEGEHRDERQHAQDRKSTRLNSSHSQISYAVFCLKKKKNTKARSSTTNNTTTHK